MMHVELREYVGALNSKLHCWIEAYICVKRAITVAAAVAAGRQNQKVIIIKCAPLTVSINEIKVRLQIMKKYWCCDANMMIMVMVNYFCGIFGQQKAVPSFAAGQSYFRSEKLS